MKQPSILALALSLVALGGSAFAQERPDAHERGHGCAQGPRAEMQRAEAQGEVARMILGPGGRAHAVQLSDGTIVMARREAGSLAVGQRIQVSGFAPQGATPRVIVRPTIRDASGNVIAQPSGERFGGRHERAGLRGPGAANGEGMRTHRRERFAAMRARVEAMPEVRVDGPVQTVVTGPRGGVRALLLANNTTLTVPRPLGRQLAERGVRAGDRIRAAGHGGTYPQGTALVAREITLPDNTRLELPAAPAAR